MRESCTSGIALGAPGNRRSYGGGALASRLRGGRRTHLVLGSSARRSASKMHTLDFSSWEAVITTLLGLVVVTVMMVGIRLLVMETVQQRRNRENRQNRRIGGLAA